jgi:hypothetical protein
LTQNLELIRGNTYVVLLLFPGEAACSSK